MKILIVDDHALVREGLAQVLQNLSPELQLLQAKDGAHTASPPRHGPGVTGLPTSRQQRLRRVG